MKKKYIVISLLLIVVVAVGLWLFLFKGNNGMYKDGVAPSYANASSEACNCEKSWFPHDQTPAPAEGDGSPFDNKSTTNCIFHQWSWQKFLWLTKPLASGNPLFLDSLTVVSPEMERVNPQLGLKLVLSAYNQAGPEGVLVSNPKVNPGQGVGDTVFYSIHINNKFMDKAISAASLINSGKLPYSNLDTFPVGAFELKVSWINLNSIPKEKRADYFTTKAAVQKKNGQYEIKSMALLGMHVVGVVKNHPEFIWATFEHKDMAPVYDWKNDAANSADEKLLYEKGKTSGLQAITWDSNTAAPVLPNEAFVLYEYGVPKVLGSNTFMVTSQSEPVNFNNIDNINKCVAANLKDVFRNYFYNGSIWLDTDGLSPTDQAKTIVKSKISSVLPDSLARGSSNLANITMETYTQTFKDSVHEINAGNLVNCFTCHQSKNFDTKRGNGKSPLYLSHVFESYLVVTKPKLQNANTAKMSRINETKTLKLKQFEEFVHDNK